MASFASSFFSPVMYASLSFPPLKTLSFRLFALLAAAASAIARNVKISAVPAGTSQGGLELCRRAALLRAEGDGRRRKV